MNACLRATRIPLVMYVHHVTSKSRDVCIYAQVVHFNRGKERWQGGQARGQHTDFVEVGVGRRAWLGPKMHGSSWEKCWWDDETSWQKR